MFLRSVQEAWKGISIYEGRIGMDQGRGNEHPGAWISDLWIEADVLTQMEKKISAFELLLRLSK